MANKSNHYYNPQSLGTHHNHPYFIGPVGGAITKHLVELGEKQLMNSTNTDETKKG